VVTVCTKVAKMEPYIQISLLNDFIFCPRSIYFHHLYGKVSDSLYYTTTQISGKMAHSAIDNKKYSTSKNILQSLDIYSQRLNLGGKIDTFNIKKKELIERKKKIVKIYDGYVYQLYAQYYCLIEMGYEVEYLGFYSMDDNKSYKVDKPEENNYYKDGFFSLLKKIRNFKLSDPFTPNPNKCKRCILISCNSNT